MMHSDYERFAKVMRTFSAIYGKTLTDDQMQVYWRALQDRTIEQVERKIEDYAKRGKFFPKPRDLRPVEIERESIESNPKAEAEFRAAVEASNRSWGEQLAKDGHIAKLRLARALLCRYQNERALGFRQDVESKIDWLRERVLELMREANPNDAQMDLTVMQLVGELIDPHALERLGEPLRSNARNAA